MSAPASAFRVGQQPCQCHIPKQTQGYGYAEYDNRRECPGCSGERSFCLNCSKDHHSNGWETHR